MAVFSENEMNSYAFMSYTRRKVESVTKISVFLWFEVPIMITRCQKIPVCFSVVVFYLPVQFCFASYRSFAPSLKVQDSFLHITVKAATYLSSSSSFCRFEIVFRNIQNNNKNTSIWPIFRNVFTVFRHFLNWCILIKEPPPLYFNHL